jgi:hypothetical protein
MKAYPHVFNFVHLRATVPALKSVDEIAPVFVGAG